MMEFLKQPIVHGALIGFWSAAVVDVTVFLKSPEWKVADFHVGTASKRWVTGFISGALGAAGLGAL